MDGFIVEKYAVGLFSMRAQALAMIGNNHDQRIVVQLAGAQRRDQFSYRCIGGGDRGIVGSGGRSLRDRSNAPTRKNGP